MARIRSIKPEFFTSEQIAVCSVNARLTFVGMWCFSDDYGVMPASIHRIKTQIFPADSFTKEEIRAWIDELIGQKLVHEYSVGGEKYWFATGWDKHQKPDNKTGLYPRPDGSVGMKIRRKNTEHTVNDTATNTEHTVNDHRPVAQGEGEGEGEVKGKVKYSSDFEDFWISYPRRLDKNRAFKTWNARLKEKAEPASIIQAAKNYSAECQNKRTAETYIKHPATFLGPDWIEWLTRKMPELTEEEKDPYYVKPVF